MDIRVSSSLVSDGKNVPYKTDAIPTYEAFRKFRADQRAMNQAQAGQVGRDGSLAVPQLRAGITIERGRSGVLVRGVDEDYVRLVSADSTRIVEVLPVEEWLETKAKAEALAAKAEVAAPAPAKKLGVKKDEPKPGE